MNIRVILQSVVRCPECGAHSEEVMPEDCCIWYYECKHCNALIRPKPGDCCVFCSYGTVKCPPIQKGGCSCS